MQNLLDQIIEPTLLLDEQKCRANIERMAKKASENALPLRPHFKTHQSHEVGRWFRDYGVDRIAVSSIRMGQYFAADNWKDITIAFPTNFREISRINDLASKTNLNLLVENLETAQFLTQNLKEQTNILIEADTGYYRTGVGPDHFDLIDQLIETVNKSDNLSFKGFLAHAGHSYKARGEEAIAKVHQESLAIFSQFRDRYHSQFPDLMYSAGDTPTCSSMDEFGVATEIRPGNFVFYDLSQYTIGSCELEDIAVAIACPIVAIYPERNTITVYGGGVHCSKDRNIHPTTGETYFGLVVNWTNNGWNASLENAYVKSLSQEHGTIHADSKIIDQVKVGDILGILPIHSCMMANLMKRYQTLEGKWLPMMAYP